MTYFLRKIGLSSKHINAQAPIAIIDIGSNTVRLVIFKSLFDQTVLHNTKVLCELGALESREKHSQTLLPKTGKAKTLKALHRFRITMRQKTHKVPSTNVLVVATAALRDANDGAAFVDYIYVRYQWRVHILKGKIEGTLSALGALSDLPNVRGSIIDLGGGSLEIVAAPQKLYPIKIMKGCSLPLGTLRVLDSMRTKGVEATAHDIKKRISKIPMTIKEKNILCVGGSLRRLARIYLRRQGIKRSWLNGYAMSTRQFMSLMEWLATMPDKQMKIVAGHRAKTLPAAMLVMKQLLSVFKPKKIMFSEHGLREGLLRAVQEDYLTRSSESFTL